MRVIAVKSSYQHYKVRSVIIRVRLRRSIYPICLVDDTRLLRTAAATVYSLGFYLLLSLACPGFQFRLLLYLSDLNYKSNVHCSVRV